MLKRDGTNSTFIHTNTITYLKFSLLSANNKIEAGGDTEDVVNDLMKGKSGEPCH